MSGGYEVEGYMVLIEGLALNQGVSFEFSIIGAIAVLALESWFSSLWGTCKARPKPSHVENTGKRTLHHGFRVTKKLPHFSDGKPP